MEEVEAITAHGIAEAMQAMNCQAVGLAAHDLAGGVDLLKKIQKEQQLNWLSMNLVDSEKKKVVFTPSLVTKIGEVSVAVLGITDDQINLDEKKEESRHTLLPWQDVLPKAVDQAGDKADMLILLSSYPYEINKKIAESLPGIDLILASGHAAATSYPVIVNNTLFAQTGSRGKYLGMMRINWTETGKWEHNNLNEIQAKQNRLGQINKQLSQLQKKIKELSKHKTYQKLSKTKKQLQAEIKKLESEKPSKDKNLCRFTNKFIALRSSLPEEPKVGAIVSRTTEEVNTRNRERALKKKEKISGPLKTLAGWQQCAKCHPDQTNFWQETGHAQSMQTLKKVNQQFNEDCLLCHVTLPYYDAARVKREKLLLQQLPIALQSVGCESCHGPLLKHTKKPTQVQVPSPTEQTCKTCHTPEHDDNFIFAEKIEKITPCANKKAK
ncbi:MAG: hypothetical protein D3923_08805 [Candidatus Electrothrix sp. AR3]|nr:hypothetical protein [Candidatus Electrothrix sp. AR3]